MLTNPSVLVVEDDADNRECLADYLGNRGFRVSVAATGEEAVALAATAHPDVVLMDLRLGAGLSGLEATLQLRARPGGGPMRIVAVTACCMPRERQAALEAGCDAVFNKPLDLPALAQFLRDITAHDPL